MRCANDFPDCGVEPRCVTFVVIGVFTCGDEGDVRRVFSSSSMIPPAPSCREVTERSQICSCQHKRDKENNHVSPFCVEGCARGAIVGGGGGRVTGSCRLMRRKSCHISSFVSPSLPRRGLFRVCACLFVSLRLRGVERRGHTGPPAEPIHQTPVASETPLRSAARALWTLQPFLFAAFLFAPSFFSHQTQDCCFFGGVGGMGEGGALSSACPEIFTISKKRQRL